VSLRKFKEHDRRTVQAVPLPAGAAVDDRCCRTEHDGLTLARTELTQSGAVVTGFSKQFAIQGRDLISPENNRVGGMA